MKKLIQFIILTTLTFGLFLSMCIAFSSCAGTKNGCGSYAAWEKRHSFNK